MEEGESVRVAKRYKHFSPIMPLLRAPDAVSNIVYTTSHATPSQLASQGVAEDDDSIKIGTFYGVRSHIFAKFEEEARVFVAENWER